MGPCVCVAAGGCGTGRLRTPWATNLPHSDIPPVPVPVLWFLL